MIIVLVSLAGGLGALLRALVDRLVATRWPAWWATLGINLAGSFTAGLAAGALPAAAFAVVGTGFCGGFTTFSTASWQVARELGRRRYGFVAAYLAATVGGCLAAAWLGMLLSA